MQITLEGNLEFFEIGELLQFLGAGGRKGSLKLVAEGKEAEIFFDKTSVVQSHVAGKWSENADHAADVMAEVLGWRKGTFAFLDAAVPSGKNALALDLMQLLADGKAKMDEKGRSGARLPDMTVVFRAVDQPETSEVEMSVKEWKFLSRFDGKKSLGEVLDRPGENREESLALVQSMFENNLISPTGKEAAPKTLSPQVGEQTGELLSHTPRPAKTAAPAPEAKPAEKEMKSEEKEGKPRDKEAKRDKEGRQEKEPKPEKVAAKEEKAPAEKTAEPEKPAAPAEPSGPIMACLTMDDGDKEMFPLLDDSYTVGRDGKNAIVIPDSSVSSMHAKLVRTADGFVIEDLKSRNGTHVNDERVEKKLLADNDSIRLGRIYLTYNIASEMKASRATMYEVKRPD